MKASTGWAGGPDIGNILLKSQKIKKTPETDKPIGIINKVKRQKQKKPSLSNSFFIKYLLDAEEIKLDPNVFPELFRSAQAQCQCIVGLSPVSCAAATAEPRQCPFRCYYKYLWQSIFGRSAC